MDKESKKRKEREVLSWGEVKRIMQQKNIKN
jgi:hypothetical protein